MKLLGPKADSAAVEAAVKEMNEPEKPLRRFKTGAQKGGGFYSPRTRDEKRPAEQLNKALQKAEKLLAKPDLAEMVRLQPEWLAELARLKNAAKAVKDVPLANLRRREERKWRAASVAAQLWTKHGKSLLVTRWKGYCKLATILYGNNETDLYNYCLAEKHRREDRNQS